MIQNASQRRLLQLAGYFFFGIGFAGILLPLLPTTIFWIAAAFCFAKSAPGMYRRILSWPGIGPAIERYLEAGAIDSRGKLAALTGMAIGAVLIAVSPLPDTAVALTLLGMTLAAAYVATRPSGAVTATTRYRQRGQPLL